MFIEITIGLSNFRKGKILLKYFQNFFYVPTKYYHNFDDLGTQEGLYCDRYFEIVI